MTGLFVSVHHRPPTYLCADEHIASGWGDYTHQMAKSTPYKEAPGDLTPVPAAAAAMVHYVLVFLPIKFGGVRYPTGPLRLDVDISP